MSDACFFAICTVAPYAKDIKLIECDSTVMSCATVGHSWNLSGYQGLAGVSMMRRQHGHLSVTCLPAVYQINVSGAMLKSIGGGRRSLANHCPFRRLPQMLVQCNAATLGRLCELTQITTNDR